MKTVFSERQEKNFASLPFNTRLLISELMSRGISVSHVEQTPIILASLREHREVLFDTYSHMLSYPKGAIVRDKFYTKRMLEELGFSVAPGDVVSMSAPVEDVFGIAGHIGYPLVIKPTAGTHGDFVYIDIRTQEQLKSILEKLRDELRPHSSILLEKYISGREFRLFVTSRGFAAAVERVPANIIGDGSNNILMLIQKENDRRMNPRTTCLCEIRLDAITFAYMDDHGITLDQVPNKGERVFLRANSNVSTGGNCYDCTDSVHASYIDMAANLLKSLRIPYVGMDIITHDISKPMDSGSIICELNPAPGLSLHMMPEKGKPRNVAGALVDLIFPETAKPI